jgi:competence protein ComEC
VNRQPGKALRSVSPVLAGRPGAVACAAVFTAHLFLLPLPAGSLERAALLTLCASVLILVVNLPDRAPTLRAAALGGLLISLRIVIRGLPLPPADALHQPQGTVSATGEVRALLAPLRGAQRAVVELDGTRVLVEAPPNPQLRVGDRISTSLEYRRLAPDAQERLRVRGVEATAKSYDVTVLDHGSFLESLRGRIGDDIERLIPAPAGGLAAAIVVGLRERVDERLADNFTATGLGHVVALSGWNVAITMAVADRALRQLTLKRRRWSLIFIALLYGLFAGASASVIRASVMSAAALLAAASGRKGAGAVALSHAVIALLVFDPAIAYDPGFRLSALATAGLLAKSANWSAHALRFGAHLPASIRPIWNLFAEDIAVSFAAQAATLGLVIALFGRVALWSIPLTLLIAPLIAPATAAAILAVLAGELALVTPSAFALLSSLLALPAATLFSAASWIAQFGSTLPGTSFAIARGATLPVGIVLGVAGVGLLLRRSYEPNEVTTARLPNPAGSKVPALAGVCILAISCLTSAGSAAPRGALRIAVLDVGQGDAILIEYHGKKMLIDGGPDPARLSAELDRIIPSWDRSIDLLVATHPHEDHLAGLPRLLDRYRIEAVIGAEVRGGGPASRSWNDILQAGGIQYFTVSTGSRFMLADAQCSVLWPDKVALQRAPQDGGSALNNRSIVLRLDIQGFSALFTGDIESDVDRVVASRITRPVDLLKSPHHGSATSASRTLLNAADPRVSIVSVGLHNSYGHPAAATLERLAEHNGIVERTDQDGTVIALIDPVHPEQIEVRTATSHFDAPQRSDIGHLAPGGPRPGVAADAEVPTTPFTRVLRSGSAGCPLQAATIGAWQRRPTLRYSSPGAMTSS